MEVHLKMHAVAADVVKKGTQLVECDPACHDALAVVEYLAIQVIPLGIASLRLADTWCPLDGVKFFYLENSREMVQSAYPVEMIERVRYLTALLAEIRLYETAVVRL